ncbi:unnamed protein product [Alternaria burnsii]|nr:unnamed protein product [Alternaria burnsii]
MPLVATLLKFAGANAEACRLVIDGYIILRLPIRETMPSQCASRGMTLKPATGVPQSGTCGRIPSKHLHIWTNAERAKRTFSDTGNRTRALPALYGELTLLVRAANPSH